MLREPIDASAAAVRMRNSADGLTAAEVAVRLERDGPNRLPVVEPIAAWRKLVAQLVHFFALMLWVAGCLAFDVTGHKNCLPLRIVSDRRHQFGLCLLRGQACDAL